MQPVILKIIGRVVIASTFMVSTLACGIQERLTTRPCSIPESSGSVSTEKLTVDGIRPIKVGMTVAEASKAAGTPLVSLDVNGRPLPPNWGGYTIEPKDSPKGIFFLVVFGRIARVDLGNRQITTQCGAKIGDTEARIKALYPGQIQVTPDKYVESLHNLTLVPKDSKDSNYRIVFKTYGSRVTSIRSGKIPEVEYVEGG